MFKYTLCFIIYQNQVLLLNRNKNPWMGRWNGVGGKINEGEDKFSAIKREIIEETQINPDNLDLKYRGIVTWNEPTGEILGLHLFVGFLNEPLSFKVPLKTREGILDLKPIEWVSDFKNLGLVDNIPYFFPRILQDDKLYQYHCHFENELMQSVEIKLLT
ncbi:MAG TPA: NUDIX domain-containing protein [Bacilli bacterium]|nr:NUDIX domain-containing protein [Bacilli bacterium]